MDHNKYLKLVSKYIDRELPGSDSVIVEQHLKDCENCRAFHDTALQLNDLMHSQAPAIHADIMARKVMTNLRVNSENKKGLPLSWARLPAYVMILALALGLGNFAGKSLIDISPLHSSNPALDLLASESENSLAAAVIDIGFEETSQ